MSFFKRVGKKIESRPSPRVEAALSRKLDAAFAKEFGTKPALNPFAWIFEHEIFRFAPVALAAVLIVVLGNQIDHVQPKSESPPIAFAFPADGIESSWLDGNGDRIEFYDEMEDWMLTASDEDWADLLEQDG